MAFIELTQTHVEEVARIVSGIPHLAVQSIGLSVGRTQVIVTVEALKVSPTTVIGHLYANMRDLGTSWYSIMHTNLPGQPVETLLFGALR